MSTPARSLKYSAARCAGCRCHQNIGQLAGLWRAPRRSALASSGSAARLNDEQVRTIAMSVTGAKSLTGRRELLVERGVRPERAHVAHHERVAVGGRLRDDSTPMLRRRPACSRRSLLARATRQLLAMTRAMNVVLPPGGNGTTSRIGFAGNAAARRRRAGSCTRARVPPPTRPATGVFRALTTSRPPSDSKLRTPLLARLHRQHFRRPRFRALS